jgi:hypothetical protein
MTVEGHVVRHVEQDEQNGSPFAVRFVNLDQVRQAFVRELVNEAGDGE